MVLIRAGGAACGRALLLKAYSYKSVESILKSNLDKQELPETPSAEKPIIHYNIRGREYYQGKEAIPCLINRP